MHEGSRLAEIPRNRDVVLIGRSPDRSGTAQRELMQLGYKRVSSVSGGLNTSLSAALPITP